MRKTTCLILFALISLTIDGHAGLRPRGDVNCDWTVNIADVNAVINAILNDTPYHALYTYAYDINGDQAINISDLNAVIGAILGDELPPMPAYSGTLPVLYIITEGHRDIVSKEEYLHADWWLDNMKIGGVASIGSPEHPQGMRIKGRGNATWTNVDKKSFRLKLDEKKEMLGMPSNRHWNLMAYPDSWKGKISDALAFEIGRRMGMAWDPLQEPVEVVLNGQYIGLYFLTEKIRVGKNRINIIEQKDNENDPANVTGGWLLEIDNYREPSQIIIDEGNGQDIRFTPHSPKELSEAQRDYITAFLTAANDAIFTEDKADNTWERFIDIDALALYYITQEVVDNPEAFSGSCYLHKEHGDSTKLVFGPLWDCGSSFERYSANYQFDKYIYEEMPSYCRTHWIAEIAKSPHFQERIRYHWYRFYHLIYPTTDAFIDAFGAKVESAGNADYVRWPQYSGNNIPLRLDKVYRPSFHKKVAWLQSQWGTAP